MKNNIKLKLLKSSIGLVFCLFAYCGNTYSPKPRGYFRIDFPEKEYVEYKSNYPYYFSYPKYGKVNVYMDDSCWVNINFPRFRATIHITYHKMKADLNEYVEQSRNLVYKHTIKADAISEIEYYNKENRTFGVLYDIKGNAASSVNFFLTDSTKHFFRGALYFNVTPNKDSLAPVIDFLKEDITKLIETFHWNETEINKMNQ